MLKLSIENINNYHYELKDLNNHTYKFIFTFYDLPTNPKINDIIYLNEELLQEEHHHLSFGSIESSYGKKITENNNSDIIIIETNQEKYLLKRLYG